MRSDFLDEERARGYHAFGGSADGQVKHDLIGRAVESRVASDRDLDILEVGTGTGWLAARLRPHAKRIRAVDGSPVLLEQGRRDVPGVEFSEHDLEAPLRFGDAEFDLAVACLVLHDLRSAARAFADLRRVLRPRGRLIVVELNSYYAHPVGSWKRTRWQKLTGARRELTLRPYADWVRREDRAFPWGAGHASYFRTLPELINAAAEAGLHLHRMEDLLSSADSENCGLHYRTYRFPIFHLLEFRKPEAVAPSR